MTSPRLEQYFELLDALREDRREDDWTVSNDRVVLSKLEDLYELLSPEEKKEVEKQSYRGWPDLWDTHKALEKESADQCGVIGDPKDLKSPVCVLKPGHVGPHRERVMLLRPILPGQLEAGVRPTKVVMTPELAASFGLDYYRSVYPDDPDPEKTYTSFGYQLRPAEDQTVGAVPIRQGDPGNTVLPRESGESSSEVRARMAAEIERTWQLTDAMVKSAATPPTKEEWLAEMRRTELLAAVKEHGGERPYGGRLTPGKEAYVRRMAVARGTHYGLEMRQLLGEIDALRTSLDGVQKFIDKLAEGGALVSDRGMRPHDVVKASALGNAMMIGEVQVVYLPGEEAETWLRNLPEIVRRNAGKE